MKAGRRRRELVAGKTSPRFHAAAPHREGKHMASRWLDRLLIVLLLFTSFMSLVYAPLFVFGCGWHDLTLGPAGPSRRSEEHTSELQSLMRISYAVFCLKKKKKS